MRPTAVTIVAGFLIAATAIALVVAYALLFPGELLEWLAQFNRPGMAVFERMGRWPGILLVALAFGTAAASFGMLRARKWAWWFAVILFTIDGCGDLVSFLVAGDWLRSASGVVICAVFLLTLGRADVRRYFSVDTGAHAAS